jgi:hypothetical protein
LFALSFLALSACEAPETDAGDASAPSAVANSTPTTQVVRTEKPASSDTSSNPTQVDMALLTFGIFKLLDEGSKLQVKFDDEMSGKGTETLSIKRDEDNLIINGIEYHRCKDTRRKV